jgi:hypothetical protein
VTRSPSILASSDNSKLCVVLCNNPVQVEIAKSCLQQTSDHYKDNTYEINAPNTIADSLKYITPAQCNNCKEPYSVHIGFYTKCKFHIELKPGAKLYHCTQPYHILQKGN